MKINEDKLEEKKNQAWGGGTNEKRMKIKKIQKIWRWRKKNLRMKKERNI